MSTIQLAEVAQNGKLPEKEWRKVPGFMDQLDDLTLRREFIENYLKLLHMVYDDLAETIRDKDREDNYKYTLARIDQIHTLIAFLIQNLEEETDKLEESLDRL